MGEVTKLRTGEGTPAYRTGLVAVLDVGSSKTVCLIGRAETGSLRVIGAALRESQGIKAGTVVGMESAEESIRDAVADALHDPSIEIVYRLGDREGWVDTDGRDVAEPQSTPERAVTQRLPSTSIAIPSGFPAVRANSRPPDATPASMANAITTPLCVSATYSVRSSGASSMPFGRACSLPFQTTVIVPSVARRNTWQPSSSGSRPASPYGGSVNQTVPSRPITRSFGECRRLPS